MSSKYFDDIDYEVLDRKTAYRGKRIVVEELHYRNPRTNQIIYREHVLAGHAAIIMPITDNNEFIMIKEPRTPIGKNVLAFPAIGYSNEQTIIFLATNLVKTERHLDETEDIEVLKIPIEEVRKMLESGEIQTSSETVGLLYYFMYEDKSFKE